MKIARMLPLAVLLTYLVSGNRAAAALTDRVWDATSAGNWSVAANWTDNALPDTNTELASINDNASGVGPVTLNGTYTLGGLSVGSGYHLQADTGTRTLTINAAIASDTLFRNAGTISSGSSGSFTLNIVQTAPTIVNSGILEAVSGGTLVIRPTSTNGFTINNAGGVIRTVGSGALTLGLANTGAVSISGGSLQNPSGTLTQNKAATLTDVTFTNGGTYLLEMPVSTGNPYGLTVAGTTSVSNSGNLNLTRKADATTTSGQALTLNLSSSGSFANSGNIVLLYDGMPQSGGGNVGMSVNENTSISNTGTITFESRSTTNQTRLFVASDKTLVLTGSGEMELKVGVGGAVSQVLITGGNSNSTLVNSAGHTIRGAGSFGNNGLGALNNAGTILADSTTNALTFDFRGVGITGTFSNSGVLRAAGAAGLVLADGAFNNSGTLQIDVGSSMTVISGGSVTSVGTLVVNGTLTSAPTLNLTGGNWLGGGEVIGNLNVSAPLSISPQTIGGESLTVTGNLDFSAAGSLRTISMQYDEPTSVLNVTGNLSAGANNAFEFTFAAGTFAGNTTYTLMNVDGGNTLDLSLFSLSALSVANGYELDSSFGSNAGWNLNGGNVEVRFLAVIPEPNGIWLLAMGAVFLALRSRRKIKC